MGRREGDFLKGDLLYPMCTDSAKLDPVLSVAPPSLEDDLVEGFLAVQL